MVDVNLTAYQNGASLEAAIPANSDSAIDAFMKEIQPGETVFYAYFAKKKRHYGYERMVTYGK